MSTPISRHTLISISQIVQLLISLEETIDNQDIVSGMSEIEIIKQKELIETTWSRLGELNFKEITILSDDATRILDK